MNNVAKWVQNVNSTLRRNSSTTCSSNNNLAPFRNDGYNSSWLHKPEVLLNAHVDYTVRYMGDVAVDEPKGNEVIKDAIRRLRFQFESKRSQGITKLPRVELLVSVKGVKMLDPKSRMVLHNHPLHRISFCADDRNDTRLFAFIVKQPSKAKKQSANLVEPNNVCGGSSSTSCNSGTEEHRCFVFLSDKLAEHITLTIGEAFDLAYRQFLDTSSAKNKNVDSTTAGEPALRKLVHLLRKRIQELERENDDLKQQLAQQQRALTNKTFDNNLDGAKIDSTTHTSHRKMIWESFDSLHSAENVDQTIPQVPLSAVPPPPRCPKLSVNSHCNNNGNSSGPDLQMRGLSLESECNPTNPFLSTDIEVFDTDFDPRAGSSETKVPNVDSSEDLAREIERNNALLAEMRDGYRRGLSIGRMDLTTNDCLNDESNEKELCSSGKHSPNQDGS